MVQSENKLSVYAGPPMWRVLEQAGSENRSSRINAVCERYDWLIHDGLRRLKDEFTRNEWCAIVDVGNGTTLNDEMTWRNLWANVMDDPEIGEKWGIDKEDLGDRMHKMPLLERAAIVEVVERFWSSPRLNKDSHDKLLRAAGAVFPDTEEAA